MSTHDSSRDLADIAALKQQIISNVRFIKNDRHMEVEIITGNTSCVAVGYNTRCRHCNNQFPVTVDPYAGMQNVLFKVKSHIDQSNPQFSNRTPEQNLRDLVAEMLKDTEARVQKILDKITGGDAL